MAVKSIGSVSSSIRLSNINGVEEEDDASTPGQQGDFTCARASELRDKLLGGRVVGSEFGKTYFQSLEDRINRLDKAVLNTIFGQILPLGTHVAVNANLERFALQFVVSVAGVLSNTANEPQRTTFHEVASNVVTQMLTSSGSSCALSAIQLEACYQATFTAIGWLGFIYDPSDNVIAGSFSIAEDTSVTSSNLTQQRLATIVERPWPRISIEFGRWQSLLEFDWSETIESLLYVSTLNFYVLYMMGKVKIEWTTTIGRHLEFDEVKRRLVLFRLPSYCALCCTSKDHFALFEKLVPQTSQVPPYRTKLFLQEIILSYRLLFGQNYKSRALFLRKELKVLNATGSHVDTLLLQLSSKKFGEQLRSVPSECWPETCLSDVGSNAFLLEQAVYRGQADFQILGPRLLKLQQFAERQSPSTLRDMWRDTRNPMQWLAYWAVLWIGGITIVVAVFQLIVGILQVVLK